MDSINHLAVRRRNCEVTPCPSPTECGSRVSLVNLCKVSSGMDVLREQQHQKTVSVVIALLATHPIETVLLKLRYMRHDGTFAAYECSKCHFGPLEHMHCDDLLEWHKREGTNNSCPRCGNLVTTIQKLQEWLETEPRVTARKFSFFAPVTASKLFFCKNQVAPLDAA